MPLSKDGNAEMHVLPVPLTLLSAISTLRVSLPTDLRQPEPRRSTLLTLKVSSSPRPFPPSLHTHPPPFPGGGMALHDNNEG